VSLHTASTDARPPAIAAGAVAGADVPALDRRIVQRLQAGLPLSATPYDEVARQVGVSPELVRGRIDAMLADGRIRRIGVVPNHYELGWRANGMSVWDVDDARVDALGERVGALLSVSHCYRRPRRLPVWPYNLFAMVHGRDRGEVAAKVAEIARVLGSASRAHDVLFSTRILKKTGLRLRAG
jgi:siroheme decarboxylase